eukprot:6211747-Pleurochrysis_carterae.AAC.1
MRAIGEDTSSLALRPRRRAIAFAPDGGGAHAAAAHAGQHRQGRQKLLADVVRKLCGDGDIAVAYGHGGERTGRHHRGHPACRRIYGMGHGEPQVPAVQHAAAAAGSGEGPQSVGVLVRPPRVCYRRVQRRDATVHRRARLRGADTPQKGATHKRDAHRHGGHAARRALARFPAPAGGRHDGMVWHAGVPHADGRQRLSQGRRRVGRGRTVRPTPPLAVLCEVAHRRAVGGGAGTRHAIHNVRPRAHNSPAQQSRSRRQQMGGVARGRALLGGRATQSVSTPRGVQDAEGGTGRRLQARTGAARRRGRAVA